MMFVEYIVGCDNDVSELFAIEDLSMIQVEQKVIISSKWCQNDIFDSFDITLMSSWLSVLPGDI